MPLPLTATEGSFSRRFYGTTGCRLVFRMLTYGITCRCETVCAHAVRKSQKHYTKCDASICVELCETKREVTVGGLSRVTQMNLSAC